MLRCGERGEKKIMGTFFISINLAVFGPGKKLAQLVAPNRMVPVAYRDVMVLV